MASLREWFAWASATSQHIRWGPIALLTLFLFRYIINNDHLVSLNGATADPLEVTLDTGEVLEAVIIARDSASDLALLKIDRTGLNQVVFAESSGVKIGQWAIAIGSPPDYRNTE